MARGITLLELMITIVVLGILASIAWPSYQNFMMKNRRSEAIAQLLSAQLKQEALRVTSGAYATQFKDIPGVSSSTENYDYSATASGSSYTLTAQPKSTSPQRYDSGCTSLTINQSDDVTPKSCWEKK